MRNVISHCGQRLKRKIVLVLIFAIIILRYVQLLNEFNSYFPKPIRTPRPWAPAAPPSSQHNGLLSISLSSPRTRVIPSAQNILLAPSPALCTAGSSPSPRSQLKSQLQRGPGTASPRSLLLSGPRRPVSWLAIGLPTDSEDSDATWRTPRAHGIQHGTRHSSVTRAQRLPSSSASAGQSGIPAQPCHG